MHDTVSASNPVLDFQAEVNKANNYVGQDSINYQPKRSHTYTFPAWSHRNGISWKSFPILDSISLAHPSRPGAAGNFFEPIMFMDVLDTIYWKVLDAPVQPINNWGSIWIGDLAHRVIPQQGYKIQMTQCGTQKGSITVSGKIPAPEQYPLTLKARAANSSDKIGNENWLGYFNPVTSSAREAFAAVIDDLWFIQTQDWTMCRAERLPGSPWLYALQNGSEPTLSFGDMVIVKCFRDFSFIWNASANVQPQFDKILTQQFSYAENLDYLPIYIELDNSDLPAELALYVEGECRGAVVVTDSLVEIPAYIRNYIKADALLEIRAYYKGVNNQDFAVRYQVWDQSQKIYINQPLRLKRNSDYYKLRILPTQEVE